MAELEQRNVIKVLRALVQSAPSDGLLVQRLLADYKENEGYSMPFRELGFKSPEELILQSGEFVQINTRFGPKIIQKESDDSMHIQRYVRERVQRSQRFRCGARTNNHCGMSARSAVPTTLSPHPSNRQNRQNGRMTQPPHTNGSIGKNHSMVTPSATSTPISSRNTNQIMQAKQISNNDIGKKLGNPILEPKIRPNAGLVSKISLTDQTSGSNLKPDVVEVLCPEVSQSLPSIIKKTQLNVQYKGLGLLAPTEALAKFCNRKGYASPTYKCFFIRKMRKFQCDVTVNKEVYSPYPEQFNTEEEARNGAARMAFQRLKDIEHVSKYEVCTDSSMELAFKIRDCICSPQGVFQKKIPELFQKMHKLTLPDKWCDIFTDYPELFSSEDGIGDQIVYKVTNSNPVPVAISGSTLAITQATDDGLAEKSLIAEISTKHDEFETNDSMQAISNDTSSDEKDVTIGAPQLQWTECNNVNVSFITDTGDIYCHLTQSKNGLKHINESIRQLTDGTSDLGKYRYGVGGDVTSRLYLIYNKCDDKWYRATILPSNSNEPSIQCFCIDYGWTKMNEREHIYLLDLLNPALSAHPAQTILVRLHEITTFNENVVQRLRGLLNTKSTVAVEVIDGSHIPMVDVYKRIESTKAVYKINDFIRMEQELLLIASELMFDSNEHSSS